MHLQKCNFHVQQKYFYIFIRVCILAYIHIDTFTKSNIFKYEFNHQIVICMHKVYSQIHTSPNAIFMSILNLAAMTCTYTGFPGTCSCIINLYLLSMKSRAGWTIYTYNCIFFHKNGCIYTDTYQQICMWISTFIDKCFISLIYLHLEVHCTRENKT
jgi:hypothetical protein